MYYFLSILIRNSITMSLFILIYTVVTRMYFKHYVAKWRYYSWLIIVFGLIIPFRPKFNILLHEGSKVANLFNGKQLIPENISENIISTEIVNHNSPMISWHFVLGVLWTAGFIVFLLYHINRHRQFIKMIKRWGEEIDEPCIVDILQNLQEELNISYKPKLLICSCINSPMMVGFVKPIILLPYINNSLDEMSFVLKHELIHFKRKDLWYKGLVFFVTAVYWFNPLVYLMAKEISIQCENSCDEEVIKGAGLDIRQKYSAIIISVIKNQSNIQSIFATSFYGSKKNVKNRILFIMNMKKKRLGLFVTCLLVGGIMATGVTFTEKLNQNELISAKDLNDYESTSDFAKKIEEDMDNSKSGSNDKEYLEMKPGFESDKKEVENEKNSNYVIVSDKNVYDENGMSQKTKEFQENEKSPGFVIVSN